MEVQYFVWARHAELGGDGSVTIVGACQPTIQATALPHSLPMWYLVASLTLTRDEAKVQHRLQFRVSYPNGELVPLSDEIVVEAREGAGQDQNYVHANAILVLLNVPFPQEGYYCLQLLFDGVVSKDGILKVVLPAPSGASASSPEVVGGD